MIDLPAGDLLELSIVIATSHSRDSLERCLATVEKQRGGHAVEILVVTDSNEKARIVRQQFTSAVLIEADRESLIPELWGMAVIRTRGRVVVLTTAAFIPDGQWVESIMSSHNATTAAVGGAIENMSGSLVDWAVYFIRYSAFMLPFRPGRVTHILGDNAAYTRDAIAPHIEWIGAHGFWESEINTRLVSQGCTLLAEPRMVVYYVNSYSVSGFAHQRFAHGRVFGRMRAAQCTATRRMFYIAISPAIPAIYLIRIFRNVMGKKRNRLRLLLALPAMIWFLICWAIGEFTGLAFG